VQDELRSLRKKISTDQENVDLRTLQKTIEKAEAGIKVIFSAFVPLVQDC
jgi:hypothetical protein